MTQDTKPKRKHRGSLWIRQERRLAIYLRDGLACCYCASGLEHGVLLTLDHVQPRSKGGGDESENLVTACEKCNSVRGNRTVEDWSIAVASYLNHGVQSDTILEHVKVCQARTIDKQAALDLIAKRGSYTKALYQTEGD